ncbi:uncharacterized protein A4U43_C04F35120 [Asparagus officinalis]|uniref:Pentatricopeptide repeat-containing protein n=1 Tax=Asparagus officinalis TaxID=4686 RepID=A0A5P1F7P4_ASPOF|nr:uncharacterized protein A4U43_C04F35120 [Asparagus officinalis]
MSLRSSQRTEVRRNRSVKSFNALLTVFVECGEFDRVLKAVEEFPESLSLNGISYNILIKANCAKGEILIGDYGFWIQFSSLIS